MREHLLGDDEVEWRHEHLRLRWHAEARCLRDDHCVASDIFRPEAITVEEQRAQRGRLFGRRDVAALALECGHELLGDRILDDDDALVRAQDRVVEALARNDAPGCRLGIGGCVDEHRHVSGADSDCRVAAAVRGSDHRGAPGGEDDGDPRVGHERVDEGDGRFFDDLDAAIWRTGRDSGLAHDPCRIGTHLLGVGVRADDDRIAGHEAGQDLEVRGRDRIRRRGEGEHDSGGPRDLDDLSAVEHPRAHEVLVAVHGPKSGRACDVLQVLVLGDTEPGLGHCLLRETACARRTCVSGGLGDAVHGRGVETSERSSRPIGPLDHRTATRDASRLKWHVGHRLKAHRRPLFAPIASWHALPIATSVRSSSSSASSGFMRMPGLNWST